MRTVKITLLVLLSLVLVLIVGLVAAVNLIDINQHKDRIARKVYQETGRELQLTGDLQWGLWPRLYLAGGPLTLGNAPGFGPEPFLSLDSFQFSVATRPLFRREVIMDRVQVAGLTLNLTRNAAGDGNWEDLIHSGEPADPAADPAPTAKHEGPPFAALALGGVDVTDLKIGWRDELSGQEAEIYHLNLLIGPLSLGEPIDLDLNFQARSNQPELEAKAAINGILAYDLDQGQYSLQPLAAAVDLRGPTVPGGNAEITLHGILDLDSIRGWARIADFRLEGLGMLIGARMEMENLAAPLPDCRGELRIDIDDLARLLAIFESPLGRQLAGVRERSVMVRSEFNLEPAWGRILLSSLEARLLGTDITANLEAEEIDSAQPRVRGAFKAAGPDLPALLAVASRLRGADPGLIPQAVGGLKDRSLLVEAEFGSEGQEVTVPHLRVRGLDTTLESAWRLRNPAGVTPAIKGNWRLKGDRLPLLLRVAALFAGDRENTLPATGGESAGVGEQLRGLAERAAAAGHNSFDLGSTLDLDFEAGRAAVSDFQATALGLKIMAGLKAEQIMNSPGFELDLELAPFNPRSLMALIDLSVPETADPKVLTRLALKGRISGTPEKIAFNPLELRLDDSLIQGEFQINDPAKNDLAFKIAIDQLDLDRYLPPETEPAPATPDTAAATAATQLPLETLRELLVKGKLQAGRLKISGLRLQNFIFTIDAAKGLIKVDPLQCELYNGNLKSAITIDARGDEPAIRTENRISGVQAGPLMRDLTGEKEKIRGRAEVNYQLSTRGADLETMKANLNGEAGFGFHEGAVVGVNIGRLLRQTSALTQGRTLAADQREAVTDFTELTGTVQIKNGLASNQDLSMKSPLLRLGGQGTVNLVKEKIDYLLAATVAATATGQEGRELEELQGITIPIRVTGTFTDLDFRPELSAAIREELGRQIEKELGRQIEKELGIEIDKELGRQLEKEGARALEQELLGKPKEKSGKNDSSKKSKAKPEDKLEEQLKDELRQRLRF